MIRLAVCERQHALPRLLTLLRQCVEVKSGQVRVTAIDREIIESPG